MKYTNWALGQVKERGPVTSPIAQMAVQQLVDALSAVRGKGKEQIFGMGTASFEPEGKPALDAALVGALEAWREHFAKEGDSVSLMALARAGEVLGISSLQVTQRFPLKCDPLGARDGLSGDWVKRLQLLDDAIAGRVKLNLEALHVVDADDDTEVRFPTPALEKMYAFVLRHEAAEGRAFSRILAAFWATTNGIMIGSNPFLVPVQSWGDSDEGFVIGCGGYVQGTLTISDTPASNNLDEREIVDRDDDGVVRARNADFGALVDAILSMRTRPARRTN